MHSSYICIHCEFITVSSSFRTFTVEGCTPSINNVHWNLNHNSRNQWKSCMSRLEHLELHEANNQILESKGNSYLLSGNRGHNGWGSQRHKTQRLWCAAFRATARCKVCSVMRESSSSFKRWHRRRMRSTWKLEVHQRNGGVTLWCQNSSYRML